MKFLIEHESSYHYSEPVAHTIQALHLRPLDTPSQKVHSWQIKVPQSAALKETRDVYGNALQMLCIERPHSEIAIRVSGVVETFGADWGLATTVERFVPRFFLRRTMLTQHDESIAVLTADAVAASDGTTLDTAHRLMNAIRAAIDYRPGTTDVATTASEALAAGSGVCQDHAHVFISAARLAGIPARYVSGYLCTGSAVDDDAGHAWAEAHIEGLGWVGFDVANCICPTDAYVRVAYGLDYLEAAPIRGLRRGGGQETMTVRLKVAEGASQQQ
ncbi:MAG: transglutaminase family protein [Parvibaculum sp.]|nr:MULTISPECIES: transglutaminase family protein [Bacteria]MDR3500208.1 transglutaminase family protein [Parvibaculum sp.]